MSTDKKDNVVKMVDRSNDSRHSEVASLLRYLADIADDEDECVRKMALVIERKPIDRRSSILQTYTSGCSMIEALGMLEQGKISLTLTDLEDDE